MRILFSTYSLAFQNPGGGEQALLALEKALKARGHTVDFYDPWTLEPVGYDVIHYFSCLENRFWAFAKERSPRTPLVVTPVLYAAPGLGNAVRALKDRLGETLGRLPDLWLAATETEASTIRRRYGGAREIRILPNGVDEKFSKADPEPFRRWLREHSSIAGPFILHVGRFHPVKNQLSLIDAAKRVGTACVFIGAADLGQESYRERCLVAGKDSATFVGSLDHEDPLLASAYAAAAVFALPSLFETFGISALEAGCAGAPLVLSDQMLEKIIFRRFKPEWISPENTGALAAALERALTRGRAAPAATPEIAPEPIKDLFWPAVAEKLEHYYQELRDDRNSGKMNSP